MGLIFVTGSIPFSISDPEVPPFANPNAISHMSETAIEVLDSLEFNLDQVKIKTSSEGKAKIENFTSKVTLEKNVKFDKSIPKDWKPKTLFHRPFRNRLVDLAPSLNGEPEGGDDLFVVLEVVVGQPALAQQVP